MRSRNALLLYFALAFGISWIGFSLAVARNDTYLLLAAMVLGPTGTALALTAALDGKRGLRVLAQGLLSWRVGGRWYAAALVAPLLLVVVLAVLSQVSPEFRPAIAVGPDRMAVVGGALMIGFGAGLFEEIGWTGFVTPRLLRRHSWFSAGVILGLPWAAWHALPDYFGRSMPAGVWVVHMLQWVVALVAFRIFMTWVYSHTRSLLIGVLMHAGFTGGQRLLWPDASPTSELIWYGSFAGALWVVVAAVVVGVRRAPTGWAMAGTHGSAPPRRADKA